MKTMVVSSLTLIFAAQLVVAAGQQRDEAQRELRAAMNAVIVDGNLAAAIEQYKAIAVRYEKTNRQVAATALLHLAECYQKLGVSEAQKIYERLLREFADQKEIATTAHARLGGNSTTPTGIVARQLWPSDSISGMEASLSPDGRAVLTPAIRDIATGREIKVLPENPSGGFAEWPVLSADSKQIAYAWCCEDGVYEVRVSPADPSAKPRTLVRNKEFTYYFLEDWSPDGKAILAIVMMHGRTTQLAWISTSNGAVRTLKSLEWRSPGLARLSPDGRFIAYDALVQPSARDREIRILAADGSRETVVVAAPGEHASPVWARDGTRLVFVSKRSGSAALWSIPVRDGRPIGPAEMVQPNMEGIRPLGFTSSGSFMYVQRLGNQNVFVQQLDPLSGKAMQDAQKLADTYVGANTTPSWSPDGKSVAYFSRRVEATNPSSPATLVIRSFETQREITIPSTFTYPSQPQWFPDGQSLLVVARNNQNTTCLYQVDLNSGATRELLNIGAGVPPAAALSSDGKTVYVRHPQQVDSIAAYDLASGRESKLAGPAVETAFVNLAASPNGRRFAYSVRSSSGSLRLYEIDVQSMAVRDLLAAYPQKGFINAVAWSPDSRAIYFALSGGALFGQHPSRVWRISVDGGAPEDTGVSAPSIGAMSVSPDGTRLVFGAGELERSEYWVLENLERAWKTPPRKTAGR